MKYCLNHNKEGVFYEFILKWNFSLALEDCLLQSLKCKGDLYTWCNRRKSDDMICAKLDRFVCNESWHNLYPVSVQENHAFFGSNHRPISINIQAISSNNLARYPKRFYFEKKWLLEDDVANCVAQGWNGSVLIPNLPDQLSSCSHVLKIWAGEMFNRLGKKIQRLRNDMEYLWTLTPVKDNIARIFRMEEIEKLSEHEKLQWKQKIKNELVEEWR